MQGRLIGAIPRVGIRARRDERLCYRRIVAVTGRIVQRCQVAHRAARVGVRTSVEADHEVLGRCSLEKGHGVPVRTIDTGTVGRQDFVIDCWWLRDLPSDLRGGVDA